MEPSATCLYEDVEWGPCQQPVPLCGYHKRMLAALDTDVEFREDREYHRKVIEGLATPTDDYLTDVELEALFRGRPRNDGRRLDQWTKL